MWTIIFDLSMGLIRDQSGTIMSASHSILTISYVRTDRSSGGLPKTPSDNRTSLKMLSCNVTIFAIFVQRFCPQKNTQIIRFWNYLRQSDEDEDKNIQITLCLVLFIVELLQETQMARKKINLYELFYDTP